MFIGNLPDYSFFKGNVYTATGGETTIPVTINPENVVIRNGIVLSPQVNYYRNPTTSYIMLVDPSSAVAGDMFYVMNLSTFHAADTYTKTEMDSRLIPVGAIMAFAHGTPDAGWLECDGGLVDQATYPTLYGKIGQSYKKVRSEIEFYMPMTGNGLDMVTYRDKSLIKGTGASYVTAAGGYSATQVFQGSTTGGMTIKLGSSFSRSAFTVEGYWRSAGNAIGSVIMMLGDAWASTNGLAVFRNSSNQVSITFNSTSAAATSTLTIADTNLHHIALTYDGAAYRVFVDGVLYVTYTSATLISSTWNGELALNWQYGYTSSNNKQASQYSQWMVTNGTAKYTAAFTPSSTAPDIFESIPNGKFRKPDLRGESLRGWDHGRGIDSFALRPIGSWQEDDFKSHDHKADAGLIRNGAGTAASITTGGGSFVVSAVGSDHVVEYTGGLETRPRNVAVMFCIKAADSVTDAGLISSAALSSRVDTVETALAGRAFRNKIINGDFKIWQRNTTQSAVGYGSADRWSVGQVGSTMTFSRQSFLVGQTEVSGQSDYFAQIAVTSVAGADNYTLIRQKIESVKTLANGKAVVHFWAKADAVRSIAVELVQDFGGYIKAIAPQVVSLSNSWKRYELTFDVPNITGEIITANTDSLCLSIWLESGSTYAARAGNIGQQSGTFSFARFQVEEGKSTPFEDRSYGVELALCQRYYEVLDQGWRDTRNTANTFNASPFNNSFSFAVDKRVVPTLSYVSAGTSFSALSFPYATKRGFIFGVTSGATGAGTVSYVYVSSFTADAEL